MQLYYRANTSSPARPRRYQPYIVGRKKQPSTLCAAPLPPAIAHRAPGGGRSDTTRKPFVMKAPADEDADDEGADDLAALPRGGFTAKRVGPQARGKRWAAKPLTNGVSEAARGADTHGGDGCANDKRPRTFVPSVASTTPSERKVPVKKRRVDSTGASVVPKHILARGGSGRGARQGGAIAEQRDTPP
jgi:hypothetical protein